MSVDDVLFIIYFKPGNEINDNFIKKIKGYERYFLKQNITKLPTKPSWLNGVPILAEKSTRFIWTGTDAIIQLDHVIRYLRQITSPSLNPSPNPLVLPQPIPIHPISPPAAVAVATASPSRPVRTPPKQAPEPVFEPEPEPEPVPEPALDTSSFSSKKDKKKNADKIAPMPPKSDDVKIKLPEFQPSLADLNKKLKQEQQQQQQQQQPQSLPRAPLPSIPEYDQEQEQEQNIIEETVPFGSEDMTNDEFNQLSEKLVQSAATTVLQQDDATNG